MIVNLLKIATDFDHWRHPLKIQAGVKNEHVPIYKRVIALSLLIFTGIASLGVIPEIIIGTAIWKHYFSFKKEKIKEKKEVIEETKKIEEKVKSYSLSDEIEVVQQLAKTLPNEGKKLCLFIGRVANEPLPEKEDEVWCSLDRDHSHDSSFGHTNLVPLNPDRIHLMIDVNIDSEALSKIKGCFNKVVLDQSVLKFLDEDPWRRMGSLLKPDGQSILITEATTGCIGYLARKKIDEDLQQRCLKNGALEIPLEELFEATDKGELFEKQLKDKYQKALWDRMIERFKTMFSKVELILDKPYPYKTFYNNEKGKDKYFILQASDKQIELWEPPV